MALELVPLTTLTVNVAAEPMSIPSGARGPRMIIEVSGGTFAGERVSGTQAGVAAADWLTMGPDGSYGTLDVRATMRTDDDALIYVTYSGKVDFGTGRVVSTPQFECGDERYEWLNRIQAVGDGTLGADGVLVYEIFEVRAT